MLEILINTGIVFSIIGILNILLGLKPKLSQEIIRNMKTWKKVILYTNSSIVITGWALILGIVIYGIYKLIITIF